MSMFVDCYYFVTVVWIVYFFCLVDVVNLFRLEFSCGDFCKAGFVDRYCSNLFFFLTLNSFYSPLIVIEMFLGIII